MSAMRPYLVRQGDYLAKIAARLGSRIGVRAVREADLPGTAQRISVFRV